MSEFDFEAHDQAVNDRYRQLAKYEAFDAIVDLALIGALSMDEALTQFRADYGEPVILKIDN